jgi:hypothetical protein
MSSRQAVGMSNLPEAGQRVADATPEAAFSALIEKRQSSPSKRRTSGSHDAPTFAIRV